MSDDLISNAQIAMIDGLARTVFGDAFNGEAFLNEQILPIYGRGIFELNKGQASMIIDDLRFLSGAVGAIQPRWASIGAAEASETKD